MNSTSERKRAIAILGMHRSGTSTLMRSLNLLGVYLGEEKDLIPPYPDNPEGFWERLDIYRLQEELLSTLHRSWDTVMPLPERWQDASAVQPFREELVLLLKQNFSDVALWGWKDPRSTLLIDLWKDVLAELGIELAFVFAVRNPLDVARSLQQRNGFPCDKGFGIWFNYNITALRAIADIPTAFLSYDKFLADWEPELRRCARDLDIYWPQDDTDLRSSMSSFIRSDLRHSCSTMEDLQKAGAPQPVLRLYELLLSLLNGDSVIDTISGSVNDLYGEFFAYSRFYQHDTAASWDARQQLITAEKKLAESDLQLAEINRQLAERSYQIAEVVNRSAVIDGQLMELNQRFQELLNSGSWKVTQPLRKLHGVISRIMRLHTQTNSTARISETHINNHFYHLLTGKIQRRAAVSRLSTVDIIIPVYNALELAETCISSVLQNSDNCRLILINDASSDRRVKDYLDSVQSIQPKKIEVMVRHNETNVGFLKTVNDAYKLTKGHFVILNSDTEVPPGWLDRLFAPIIGCPESVASVTPFSNSSMGWLGCNFPDPEHDSEIFKNMSVAQLDSFFSEYSIDAPIEIFSGCGFCMAFNRAVVDKIGLFNYEVFGRGYCEEVDWSLRVVNAGYKNVLAPDLFVFHKYGASFDSTEKQNLQEFNLRKLIDIHGSQTQEMMSLKAKDAIQSIRDAIAIIADAHTKGSDRWMAVIGGEKSFWDSITEKFIDSRNHNEVKGIIFIGLASLGQSLKLHVLTSVQDREVSLPYNAYNNLDQILSFLRIDNAIIVENTTWPDAINILDQIKRVGCQYESIRSVTEPENVSEPASIPGRNLHK